MLARAMVLSHLVSRRGSLSAVWLLARHDMYDTLMGLMCCGMEETQQHSAARVLQVGGKAGHAVGGIPVCLTSAAKEWQVMWLLH